MKLVYLFLVVCLASSFAYIQVSTINGEQIQYTELTKNQENSFDDSIDNYNQNVKTMPPLITDFLGDETVRTHVKLSDGSTAIAGSNCKAGQIESSELIGNVDSENEMLISKNELLINNQKKEYTVALYIDEDTIERIANSKNPQKEFVNAWGTEIRYEGLNIFSGTKTFFIGITLFFYSFFIPEIESCSITDVVTAYTCKMGSANLSAHYELTSEDFSELGEELDEKGPNGYAAITRAEYEYTYCPDVSTTVDQEECNCTCNATIGTLNVSVVITQDLPTWTGDGYANATANQKAEWDRFMEKLRLHEDGHSSLYTAGKSKIENSIDSPSKTATAATCQKACEDAVGELDQAIYEGFEAGITEVDNDNKEYDDNTTHGATQGAVLDYGVR
ncbi:MAG: DUF922 domain-containing protein [Candidatus Micrarchaeota archaeon]